jgi:hypothetical protein
MQVCDHAILTRALALTALILFHAHSLCFADESGRPVQGLFATDEPLIVALSANWRELARRKDDRRYPATLAWTDDGGRTHTIAITVEARGRSRRELCRFPPVRLRFPHEQSEASPFQGQRALKLVTHCDNGARWERYLARELLAYRIHNQISDYSFRVRPLQISYQDTSRRGRDGPRPAFLIEDERELARRLGLERVRGNDFRPAQIDADAMSRFVLFQLLIGNVDWSVLSSPGDRRCCHNARLLGPDPLTGLYHPIPYDFDSSGLVDPHYAAPPANLGLKDIRERRYRGFCSHHPALEQARQHLLSRETEILAQLEGLNALGAGQARHSRRYLGEFFELLRDRPRFEREVTANCRR